MLQAYIEDRRRQRDLLLMTHIVIGYPSLASSLEIVDEMVDSGVDLMELQIPFSEPMADGPVILRANQQALAQGIRVDDCFAFAETVTKKHSIPFLFMSYCNPVFVRGIEHFVAQMKQVGICGAIVPDLPHEEAAEYLKVMQRHDLAPIFLFSPNSPQSRLEEMARLAAGFIYCVARKGVTGKDTDFSAELGSYLERCRHATKLPLALGFGVKSRGDLDYLRGKVDIAVVGSETLRIVDAQGTASVGPFIRSLVHE
jgi:tryptophan synthase alpha chain